MLRLLSAKTPVSSQHSCSLWLQVTIPSYMQYFMFVLIVFHKAPVTPSLSFSARQAHHRVLHSLWEILEHIGIGRA